MKYFLLLIFSISSFANDHSMSTDFSDCKGKVVNYYVSISSNSKLLSDDTPY